MLRADQVIWIKFNPLFQTLSLLSCYFVESLLNVNLTRSDLFHSHLESLPGLQRSEFSKQVRGLNSDGPVISDNHSTFKTLAMVPSTLSRLMPSPFSPLFLFSFFLVYAFHFILTSCCFGHHFQISFGYSYKAGKYNRVNISGTFNEHVDPSRQGGFTVLIC